MGESNWAIVVPDACIELHIERNSDKEYLAIFPLICTWNFLHQINSSKLLLITYVSSMLL